jgi:hypothetical protein
MFSNKIVSRDAFPPMRESSFRCAECSVGRHCTCSARNIQFFERGEKVTDHRKDSIPPHAFKGWIPNGYWVVDPDHANFNIVHSLRLSNSMLGFLRNVNSQRVWDWFMTSQCDHSPNLQRRQIFRHNHFWEYDTMWDPSAILRFHVEFRPTTELERQFLDLLLGSLHICLTSSWI